MKKSKKKIIMKKNAKRMLVFGFFSVITIVFVFGSVFSVIKQIVDKYQEAEEEEKLNNEILKLQDADYLAGYAREKYFYSKKGELIIRLPSNNEQ